MLPERPLVSVIVPNYNYSRSLGACIRAIQAQDYDRVELIVVDDCSTDGSAELARELGARVVSTGVNSGVAVARNTGVEASSGEVLLFVDSDVAIPPHTVRRSVQLLAADATLGAVCGMYEPDPLIRDSIVEECRALQAYQWRRSAEGVVSFLFSAICAMRAEVFHDVGPFNPRLRQTEEVDYGFRLSQRYKVLLTSEIRGRHDDDDRIWPLLRKLFHRGRLRIPLYTQMRKFARGFETASRAGGSVAALGAVATLPIVALTGPAGLAVPLALWALSVYGDRDTYAFVRRYRGTAFLVPFAGVSLLVNVAIAAGAATGVLQALVSPGFRALYDEQLAYLPRPAGEPA
ncbi:glycosyltransferase family 2 protein [Actinoplanes sp. RD1]|uniref:glycosyltransferase family 2 protein n=1 Tax=Actinoplanes sp. RD1 TaxID=3064538 RepID=UPI00274041D8|nr:glycosyltransferase family 2 protein [Actinoplanes sp. RD1]